MKYDIQSAMLLRDDRNLEKTAALAICMEKINTQKVQPSSLPTYIPI